MYIYFQRACCIYSFPACYGSEFSPIPDAMEGGVPLEHLISCVPGIQIQVSSSGVKKIQWAENKPPSQIGQYRISYSNLLHVQGWVNEYSNSHSDFTIFVWKLGRSS